VTAVSGCGWAGTGSSRNARHAAPTNIGYYWPRTQTVGLKQVLSEQQALVAERPDVFEVQFTSGGFGWVVVHLASVEADELS
jgi:hypothetical protein